jgi:uncharacterized protein
MHHIVSDNIIKIRDLCAVHKVATLFAFGSVCTDKFGDSSDIDLLISFKDIEPGEYADNFFDIADKLEDLFNRPVDLITDKSLSNPYLINSINKTRVHLYG